MHKIRLEGDHQTLTFGLIQLFDLTQPQGPTGASKWSKKGFNSRFAKWKLGIWGSCIKLKLKVAIKHSLLVLCNFSIQCTPEELRWHPGRLIFSLNREKIWVKISKFFFCFHCKARPLIRALGTKNTYASVFVFEKRPLKVSKQSISVGGGINGPLFRFFGAFGP